MGNTFTISKEDSNEDITKKLQIRQTLVTTLNVLQFIGAMFLLCETLIIGFSIVSVPPGSTAVPHAIWALAPFFASFAVALFTRFEVGLYIDSLIDGVYYCYATLITTVVVNGIFLAFLCVELSQGTTDFYVQSYGFLLITIIAMAVLIAVEFFLFGAIWIFRRDLEDAYRKGWQPTYKSRDPMYEILSKKKEEKDMESNEPEGDPGSNVNFQFRQYKRPVSKYVK